MANKALALIFSPKTIHWIRKFLEHIKLKLRVNTPRYLMHLAASLKDGQLLKKVDQVRSLCYTITSDLCSSKHCRILVRKTSYVYIASSGF